MARASVLLSGSLYGGDVRAVVVPKERSANIDDPMDLAFAEFLLTRHPLGVKAS